MTQKMIDIEMMCDQYKTLKNRIADLEKEADQIKKNIISKMEGKKEVVTNKYTVKNVIVSTTRFDVTDFRKEFADLYDDFSRTTQSTRFTIV